MSTPADELKAAAEKLRPSSPAVTEHTEWALICPAAADALADWLDSTSGLHEPQLCDKHEGCAPLGCQWCGDEDFPCTDMRHALAVARQINAQP